MGTEVFSWRLSRELKSDLEREARRRKTTISAVVNLAVSDWLRKSALQTGEDGEQRRLHDAASNCLGTLAGGNSRRAETARQAIGQRLRRH
jgi:predicted transcriptional regulator